MFYSQGHTLLKGRGRVKGRVMLLLHYHYSYPYPGGISYPWWALVIHCNACIRYCSSYAKAILNSSSPLYKVDVVVLLFL